MIAEMPLKQRQILAVSLLIIVLLLAVIFLFRPFISSYLNYGESIDSLEQQMQTYQRLAQGLEQTEGELQLLQQNNPSADYYLPENKPALAAARLQQYLNNVIRNSGGQVVSTQILNKSNDAPLQGIAIQVHLRLEINELVTLLHGIESGKPLLFIENLAVTASVRRQSRQQRQKRQKRLQRQRQKQQQGNARRTYPRADETRTLDVRFDLIGYAAKEPTL